MQSAPAANRNVIPAADERQDLVSNVAFARVSLNSPAPLKVVKSLTAIEAERAFTPVVPVIQADAAVVSIWGTLLRMVVRDEFDPSHLLVMAQEGEGIPTDLVPRSALF